MHHHTERNSWIQQVRLIFLKHFCQSILNYPRDQSATSIHQSQKIKISLCSLCHASFPLNHTESNGSIAQCLEQHFAFLLWYLPQRIRLAFSFLIEEGAKYFARKKSCVLKTYRKKYWLLVFGQLVLSHTRRFLLYVLQATWASVIRVLFWETRCWLMTPCRMQGCHSKAVQMLWSARGTLATIPVLKCAQIFWKKQCL